MYIKHLIVTPIPLKVDQSNDKTIEQGQGNQCQTPGFKFEELTG